MAISRRLFEGETKILTENE